MHELMRIKA